MDFGKLKQLVKKLGGLLVLDGDEPALVVLSYDKYQKIDMGEEIPVSPHTKRGLLEAGAEGAYPRYDAWVNGLDIANEANGDFSETTVEKLNQEILVLKEEIRQKEEAELVGNEQSTEAVAELVDLD